jgi:hypothetical protein
LVTCSGANPKRGALDSGEVGDNHPFWRKLTKLINDPAESDFEFVDHVPEVEVGRFAAGVFGGYNCLPPACWNPASDADGEVTQVEVVELWKTMRSLHQNKMVIALEAYVRGLRVMTD